MKKQTTQPVQEFPVNVQHGDFQTGTGHWFRVTLLPDGSISAQFDMKTDEGSQEIIAVGALVRLDPTSGRIKAGDWLQRYLFPPSASLAAANMSLVHLRDVERSSERVRFVCETETGQYFCGEMERNGFRLAQKLMQQANPAPA